MDGADAPPAWEHGGVHQLEMDSGLPYSGEFQGAAVPDAGIPGAVLEFDEAFGLHPGRAAAGGGPQRLVFCCI